MKGPATTDTRSISDPSRLWYLALGLSILCCSPAALADTVTRATSLPMQPRLTVVQGTLTHDFGTVRRDSILHYRVGFENAGNGDLLLRHPRKTCGGCSSLRLSRNRVAPGERAFLETRLTAGPKPGPQRRKLLLETNDPATSPVLTLEMEWTVRAYVRASPEKVQFGNVLYGRPHHKRLLLTALSTTASLRLRSIGEPVSGVRVTTVSMTDSHRAALQFTVTENTPIGELKGTVAVDTGLPDDPVVRIPVEATVVGPFQVDRSYLNFGSVHAGERRQVHAMVLRDANSTHTLQAPELDTGLLQCHLLRRGNKAYLLEARLQPTVPSGSVRTTITLRTTCPMQPEIEIPVFARVR